MAPVPAQKLEQGYQSGVRGLASGDAQVAVAGAGRIVYFNGSELICDDSVSQVVLLSFATPVFGSFTVQVSPTEVLFGESSNQGIWKVPFVGGGQPTLLANITFNYDAVPFGDNHAIVSAKTGGFGANDNDLLAVNLTTGQVDTVAVIPGASGPLAVDAADNLYYATSSNSFPPAAGSVDILRFDRVLVQSAIGPTVLAVGSATVCFQGLDSASGMVIDGDDDVFVTDYSNSHLVEISDINGGQPRASVLMDYAGLPFGAAGLTYVRTAFGPAGAQFEPFQAPLAGALAVHESAWGGVSQVRYLTPRRPVTVIDQDPVPPVAFAIQTSGGPTNATGALAMGVASAVEQPLRFSPFEQTMLWGLGGPAIVFLNAPFDGLGVALTPLQNPGIGSPAELAVQAVFLDPSNRSIGSGPVLTFTLQ